MSRDSPAGSASGLSGLSDEIEEALAVHSAEARSAPAQSTALVPQPPLAPVLPGAAAGACLHPVRYGNLCVKCGQDVSALHESQQAPVVHPEQLELYALRAASSRGKRKAGPSAQAPEPEGAGAGGAADASAAKLMRVSYMGGGITVSEDDAARAGQRMRAALLDAKKLMLVLDLDHTLLNSKADARLEAQDRAALAEVQGEQARAAAGAAADAPEQEQLLFHLPHRGLWTKLRPGVFEFLSELGGLFDLHVYTMGDRVYAHEMASLLDRSGVMFRNKIISRNDSLDDRQKDLRLLMGAEDMVLIVDDTASVWAECADSIMQVERYHYFPPSPERNAGPPTAALLRKQADEKADDGQLQRVAHILKEVHARYYGPAAAPSEPHPSGAPPGPGRDARRILADLRKAVLAGCVVVFSKVIPLAQQQRALESHPLWVMARQLGAQCATSVTSETTHVVALSSHTDKVQQALKAGRHVVHPAWLTACYFQWRQVDETLYPAPEDEDSTRYMRNMQRGDLAAVAAAGGGFSQSKVHI